MANKIKCSHILVEKQSQAIAILDRIKQGEKFGKLAKELSIDSGSAKRDGNLGYFGRGKMVKEFETVAFSLEVGKISEPVKTQYGYHIIKRLS
uniref:peptidylprolyl isomerase n=1 Tax=uncultured marine thaumarchaeote KM3_182_G12 TaxID=1456067 RepID=A0A075GN43_9ARCH|nr:parvulin-like peptidyl-prolyl isomerase (prsA) [uncultured marine thaumarchaeote KM3_182_G12]